MKDSIADELAAALEIAMDALGEHHRYDELEDYAWFRYGSEALRRHREGTR
jgi:hypothetical protein